MTSQQRSRKPTPAGGAEISPDVTDDALLLASVPSEEGADVGAEAPSLDVEEADPAPEPERDVKFPPDMKHGSDWVVHQACGGEASARGCTDCLRGLVPPA